MSSVRFSRVGLWVGCDGGAGRWVGGCDGLGAAMNRSRTVGIRCFFRWFGGGRGDAFGEYAVPCKGLPGIGWQRVSGFLWRERCC
ncbi:MAG: hypothetical protein FWD57_10355 [Polyangiaceae bacterium]|nr:hypothetical protein [Polyangiaceae bacterium]